MKSHSLPILSVPPTLSASLDPASRAEMQTVLGDSDPEFAGRDLLNLGRRWEAKGEDARAAQFFSLILESEVQGEIKRQARAELDAMLGRGHSGRRLEYLAARFARDLTDYRQLLPILAAGWVGELAGAAALAKLGRTGRSIYATRSLAAGAALLAETPVFVGLHRTLARAGENSLGMEIGSTALGFGAMKLFGGLGRNAMSFAPRQLAFAKPVVFQASLFAGLLTARYTEEAMGIRERASNATLFPDTLAAWLGLRIGAGLGQAITGARLKPRPQAILVKGAEPFAWMSKGAMGCFAIDWPISTSSFSGRLSILLGLGGLAAVGLGLYRLVRWAHVPRPRPGEFFYSPSPSDRWLLREFFPLGKVPEQISWTAWKRVQAKVLLAAGLLGAPQRKEVNLNWKRLALRKLALDVYASKEFHYLRTHAPRVHFNAESPMVFPDPFPHAGPKAGGIKPD